MFFNKKLLKSKYSLCIFIFQSTLLAGLYYVLWVNVGHTQTSSFLDYSMFWIWTCNSLHCELSYYSQDSDQGIGKIRSMGKRSFSFRNVQTGSGVHEAAFQWILPAVPWGRAGRMWSQPLASNKISVVSGYKFLSAICLHGVQGQLYCVLTFSSIYYHW